MAASVEERAAFRIDEVRQLFGCSRDTVDRLIASGELRSWKIGRARFVSASEIERFMAEREAEAR